MIIDTLVMRVYLFVCGRRKGGCPMAAAPSATGSAERTFGVLAFLFSYDTLSCAAPPAILAPPALPVPLASAVAACVRRQHAPSSVWLLCHTWSRHAPRIRGLITSQACLGAAHLQPSPFVHSPRIVFEDALGQRMRRPFAIALLPTLSLPAREDRCGRHSACVFSESPGKSLSPQQCVPAYCASHKKNDMLGKVVCRVDFLRR